MQGAKGATMLPMDIMLRDRFVYGLRNEMLQQRLFDEVGLTFDKAVGIALRFFKKATGREVGKSPMKSLTHWSITK